MKFLFKSKRFLSLFLVVLSFLVLCGSSYAADNKISSVVISKSKELRNGYELNIDSTQPVDYKTKIINDDSVIFELKNSSLEDDATTYYEDANNIDSVVVKQSTSNRVKIYVQGKNAKNTEVLFVNSLFETSGSKSKKININQPLNQYQPTNHLNDLSDQGENAQDWDDNSFNMLHLSESVLAGLRNGAMGFVLIFLAIFALIIIAIKSVSKKFEQDNELFVGLNDSLNLNNNNNNIPVRAVDDELDNISQKSETLKKAQKELALAHQKYQNYLQEKYKNASQPKMNSINVDAIKKGIALNQYQKSVQNPYKNQQVLKMHEKFTDDNNDSLGIPPRPKMLQHQKFTAPYIKRETKSDYIIHEPKNTTSGKFLESVSRIYEKSGRSDLIRNLNGEADKTKQTI